MVAAVFRPQVNGRTVKRMMEVLYAQNETAAIDKLSALSHNPFLARFEVVKTLHGRVEWTERIFCGDNPYLYARLVDNLRVRDDSDPDLGLIWDERSKPAELDYD